MTSKDSDQTALKVQFDQRHCLLPNSIEQHFETSIIAGILSCAIQIILLIYAATPGFGRCNASQYIFELKGLFSENYFITSFNTDLFQTSCKNRF